jgi:hypothetical protein
VRIAPFVVLALVPLACRDSLDHRSIDASDPNARLCTVSPNIQSCLDAANQEPSLSSLEMTLFEPKCGVSSCHDGGGHPGSDDPTAYPAAYLDFRDPDSAYASLVNKPSQLDPTRMIVVPGNPAQSFLMVMMGQIKPEEADPPLVGGIPLGTDGKTVGTMPQSAGSVLCCQKLDAVARWIGSGAPMM